MSLEQKNKCYWVSNKTTKNNVINLCLNKNTVVYGTKGHKCVFKVKMSNNSLNLKMTKDKLKVQTSEEKVEVF